MKTKIVDVTSPSHDITSTKDNKKRNDNLYHSTINLNSTATDLDRDIVILVKTDQADKPLVLIENNGESNVLMLSLAPKLEEVTEDPQVDVVFLVDCSGSMKGASMKLARDGF